MTEKNISTTSGLMQDNSNELIFGQKHNGIDCALCPTAKRACDRAWVTAKQIENWSKMSTMTLNRRLHELEECERISRLSDLINVDIPTETGAVKTTLYNLNVLNQLAMICIDNEKLNKKPLVSYLKLEVFSSQWPKIWPLSKVVKRATRFL